MIQIISKLIQSAQHVHREFDEMNLIHYLSFYINQ